MPITQKPQHNQQTDS